MSKLDMDPRQLFQLLQIFDQVKDKNELRRMFRGTDPEAVKDQLMVTFAIQFDKFSHIFTVALFIREKRRKST
jgi:hypothetical protein